MNARKFSLLFFLLLLRVKISLSQNKINSRLFYLRPPLYDSKSKIRKINFLAFRVLVSTPKNEREKFYGEVVYKKLKVKPREEFFKTPIINEIQKKIELDFKRLGASQTQTAKQPLVVINPTVEVFYPKVVYHHSYFSELIGLAKAVLSDCTHTITMIIANKQTIGKTNIHQLGSI